jgi:ATP/maltotriose-dependent transcriptional regulator MalT
VLTHAGRLGEARRLAMQALNFARKQGDQRGEGAAQLYLSTISFVAGEHPGSEQRARRAAEIGARSLRASALAAVARALLAQDRRPEALEQARAAAAELAASGRLERYESLVHLALAEALAANGDQAGARAAVHAAAARLQTRAGQLSNPDWRRSFLTKLPDNARILALAREWGLAEDTRPVRVDAGGGASGLGPQA